MKVTVKNNAESDIFTKGTLVVHITDDSHVILVTESGDKDIFQGILIHSDCISVNFIHERWVKSLYKKFSGKITLEQ